MEEDQDEAAPAQSAARGVSHKTRQMIRYAAARSRCEICHNTQFSIRPETIDVGGREYAVVTCIRCGRMGLHDMVVLRAKSAGAPIDTADD
ncbi:MAG: RNase P subunit RPR2 [Rhodothermales bacterium]|jgi:RNase P subunit RPR2